MKEFLKKFFEYNYQINKELDKRFKSYDYELDAEICRLANHILNAQQVWIDRINQNKPKIKPWDDFPIESFSGRNELLNQEVKKVLDSKEVEEIISYRNFSGVRFESRILDVLMHLVNHSTYHRGQIAMQMRKMGMEPISSDYIHFKS
ncbi:putative damage-inducible protein DinB [Algoriphagus sp. 4150]|uniref:DinB family protein n=1 Tax=Algoriphagus sp. 4150 TaxID=2817756 RepID=UPI0028667370|nr:DinB family protein [Algoriphagus sp. 4150]MDR7130909.1 putative damage-inducible protein DinB [Algoriphagus sp. 4150]